MKDLVLINKELPVINVNFEEVKEELKSNLEQYKKLVVTEESLSVCKANQKDLAGLRTKIDSYRKDIKKTMSQPITDFENKCKELISLVEEAEKPLKEGIKVYDDMRREEKKQQAIEIIKETIEKHGIIEKYASRLDVLDKYTNLTAKVSDVREDVEQRAFILLGEQQKEAELLELIQDAIDTANTKINQKLSINDFQRYINMGMSTKEVIQSINSQAEKIYLAENPPVVEEVIEEAPVEEVIEEAPVEEEIQPVEEVVEKVKEDIWKVDMAIKGTAEEFSKLKEFLVSNNINYTVTSKEKC